MFRAIMDKTFLFNGRKQNHLRSIPFTMVLVFLVLFPGRAFSQCNPVDCRSNLPAWGGICDSTIINGMVNQNYIDYISFWVTTNCMDAGSLNNWSKGISAKILKMHDITFSNLPKGLTGVTDKTIYEAPSNGCGTISGIPTEAGVFHATIEIMADIRTWPFSPSCSGFFYVDKSNVSIKASLLLNIIPYAKFYGPDSVCCIDDPPVQLIPKGTKGGTFSGPGVVGTTFTPSLAGPGTHTIVYHVGAQEGEAFAPTFDSAEITVKVLPKKTLYADSDHDGYGNPNITGLGCYTSNDWSDNNLDCNDTNAAINPSALDIPYNQIDEDCSGADSIRVGFEQISSEPFKVNTQVIGNNLVVEVKGNVATTLLKIHSNNGTMISQQSFSGNRLNIDISKLSRGHYFVSLTSQEGKQTISKFFKK
jgi:hypothetical protein